MAVRVPWYDGMFAGLYGKVLPKVFTPEQTLAQAQGLRRLLRLRKGQRVLDIPCGQGRLTVPLAGKGLRMTGIDLQPGYIRQARRAAKREGLDICFRCGDMLELDAEAEFDAVINWFGSFGYFGDRDNLDFCRRALRALKPGGQFLLETMNRGWLLSHFQGKGESTVGTVHIKRAARWDARRGRIVDCWTMSEGGKTERRPISIRLYNSQELRSVLKTAGFTDIRLMNDLAGGRVSRHRRRLIAVARRPKE